MPATAILIPGAVHTISFLSNEIPAEGPVQFCLYEIPWQHCFEFFPDNDLRMTANQLLRDHESADWLYDLEVDPAGQQRISLHGRIPAPPTPASPPVEGEPDPPADT
jgi:hypothetical protein